MPFGISSDDHRQDINIKYSAQISTSKNVKGVRTYKGKTADFMRRIGKAAFIETPEGQRYVVNKRSLAKRILMAEGTAEKDITDLAKDTLALKVFAKKGQYYNDLLGTVRDVQALALKGSQRRAAAESQSPAKEELQIPAPKEKNFLPKDILRIPNKLKKVRLENADILAIKSKVRDYASTDKRSAQEIQEKINDEIRSVIQEKIGITDNTENALEDLQNEIAKDRKNIRKEILDENPSLSNEELAEKELEARGRPYTKAMQAKVEEFASSSDFQSLVSEYSRSP